MSEHGPEQADKADKVDSAGGHATAATSSVSSGSANEVAKTIGSMLQAARQAQHIPLDEISVRLKVPVARLEMVERGDLDGLLDVTFAQGLMRAYGRVLNVDLGDLPARLKGATTKTALGLRPEGGLGQTFSGRSSMDRATPSWRWIWIALAVIVVGALILVSLDRIRTWLADESDVFDHATTMGAPADHAVGSPGSESGMVSHTLPAAPLHETASAAVAQGASAAAIASPLSASVTPVPTTVTSPITTGDVVIQFSEPVWFEVRDQAGKILASGTARAGDEQVLSGSAPPYSFVFGNARGVSSLKVAGQTIDVTQYARNNVARMKLPQ